MSDYRGRFKEGLDRYQVGDVAGALSFWEPLYHDLGPARGYRVGYNLARAYEVVGDATRAAERYQSFLSEAAAKQTKGEAVEDIVLHEVAEAHDRLDELGRTRARIHVGSTTPPVSVRIDQSEPRLAGFVAYVAPGGHDVIFAPGSASERLQRVVCVAGQVVEIAEEAPVVTKHENPPIPMVDKVIHPFPAGWVWAVGLATLAAGAFPAGAYVNAKSIHDAYAPPYPTAQPEIDQYNRARTLAYASWAAPAAFVVTTAIMVTVYVLGKKKIRVPQVALAF